MKIRVASVGLVAVAVAIAAGSAWTALAQQAPTTDDVQEGHKLAVIVCSNCHIAASDQPIAPILRPPAPSFESIAQRSNTTTDSVQAFLASTHRSISNPVGMPNPMLLDYQIKQAAAYLLSLRKP